MNSNTQSINPTALAIGDCLALNLKYANMLAADIPAEQFGHMPHPMMNHPAFCFGHLSIYPNEVLRMIDREDLVVERQDWIELFDMNATCVEQDGRYPAKDEIMAYFTERHEAVAQSLPQVTPGTLDREHDGYFKGTIATVGGAVNFMLASHTMVHLGQVSAWRRAMGLGSAM